MSFVGFFRGQGTSLDDVTSRVPSVKQRALKQFLGPYISVECELPSHNVRLYVTLLCFQYKVTYFILTQEHLTPAELFRSIAQQRLWEHV